VVVGRAVATVESSFEFLARQEFQILQAQFSSGVRLPELRSIALVLSSIADLPPPGRDAKRQLGLMVQWFVRHWNVVSCWLPFVTLRDEQGLPIDGRRELNHVAFRRFSSPLK
jgi:hypothetical protein